jgi:hypothetical protein
MYTDHHLLFWMAALLILACAAGWPEEDPD